MKNYHVATTIVVLTLLVYWRAINTCHLLGKDDNEIATQRVDISQLIAASPKDPLVPELLVKKSRRQYDPAIFDIDVSNYTGPARAFPKWQHPFPCFPVPRQLMITKPSKQGLLFQRPHKAGSTTISGIIMRIAHRRAQQKVKNKKLVIPKLNSMPKKGRKYLGMTKKQREETYRNDIFCDHRANHGSAVEYQYAFRDKRQSFLFSIVRNPTRRSISHFFHFGVTAYRKVPTDYNFQQHLLQIQPNRLLHELSVVPLNRTAMNYQYEQIIRNVLDEYDFIAILERLDESLVVMKMLLGLDFEEILYIRERSEGTFTNGDRLRPCVYIIPSFLTPGMTKFLTSDTWTDRIEGDVLLYKAVHKSLDLTIDRLGREEFQRQLSFFLQANQRAQERCASRAVGMCTANGAPVPLANRTCYIWSEGCSHACLNEIRLQDFVKR